ncbi:putative Vitamin B6 photo-protection and homoeostasis [Trypanosoma cruzi]|nr:putative Vitamin B6 photo-protection and homoeostasis [Trypanosoma cruzi]
MMTSLVISCRYVARRCVTFCRKGSPMLRYFHQGILRGCTTGGFIYIRIECSGMCQRRCISSAPTVTVLKTNQGRCKNYSAGDDNIGANASGAASISSAASVIPPSPSPNTDRAKNDTPHMKEMGFSQCKNMYTWEESSKKPGAFFLLSHREGTPFQRLFLFGMPRGYPESCEVGFRRYFLLSLCSSSVSSFASSIGFQSILNGFFLGSSPQLWMMKDLLPALAAAYLANRIVSYENRPKFWFFVSVGLQNLSVVAEMLVPSLLPQHLLLGAIMTSCARQSASLIFLVSRAAALQHFAVSNNLAELTKKLNSFGMVIYTIFTAFGIMYTSVVTSLVAQLATVLFCCALNLVLSYQSMSKIAFRILNVTTLSVVLRDYVGRGGIHRRHIPTPQEVSDRIGLRMLDEKARDPNDRTRLLYVSPPVSKLRISFATLEQDVLYACSAEMFLLALWEPAAPLSLKECWRRWELPESWNLFFSKFSLGAAAKGTFICKSIRQRLVLLVHQECDSLHLLTAYLLAYTALLYHAETVGEITRFLRSCNEEQSVWLRHGAEFREALRRAGWDVEQLALDPPDFRLSNLHFAMRSAQRSSCRAGRGGRFAVTCGVDRPKTEEETKPRMPKKTTTATTTEMQ